MPFSQAISEARNGIVAIVRIRQLPNNQFNVAICGSAWCIVKNKFLVTAHHIFNEGLARDVNDKFLVFSVPQNGPAAFHVPVVSFPLEDNTNDIAIIEIDTSVNPSFQVQNIPVTFRSHQDGEKVLTLGFPAPQIFNANIDANSSWLGGNMFLKSYANEGMISGQFDLEGQYMYEFNVGWYQGESGGPILSLNPTAVFSIMQVYRNVATPHGVVPGPHQGRSLAQIENHLRRLGATIV